MRLLALAFTIVFVWTGPKSVFCCSYRLALRRSLEFGYPPREETAGRVSDGLSVT